MPKAMIWVCILLKCTKCDSSPTPKNKREQDAVQLSDAELL